MNFKKLKGVRLSYAKQGMIFFTCLNYRTLDKNKQEYIKQLCRDIAGGDWKILFRIITSSLSVRRAAMEHYISEKKLYRWRREFFERY